MEINLPKCPGDDPSVYRKKNCSGSDFQLTKEEIQSVLELHNEKRALHGVPPLVLSERLSRYSQELATHLATERLYWHTPDDGFGENVWNSGWEQDFADFSPESAVEDWYKEARQFNYRSYAELMSQTRHFSQMVWKESTVLGVGAAKGSDGSWYLVCTYKPPGNIVSKIGRNVLPRSYGLILGGTNLISLRLTAITFLLLILCAWYVFYVSDKPPALRKRRRR